MLDWPREKILKTNSRMNSKAKMRLLKLVWMGDQMRRERLRRELVVTAEQYTLCGKYQSLTRVSGAMEVDQQTFIPGRHKLDPGQTLAPDLSTYEMLHTLEPTWPCL